MFEQAIAETSPETAAPPAVDDLRQVVADVFAAMLRQEIEETPVPADDRGAGEVHIDACVQITGAWQGTIVVETSPLFARRAAAAVFDLELDRVAPEDVHDALAELANMIGGNIKTLLPGPSALSLPSVTEGRDFLLRLPGTQLVQQADLRCGDETVRILICRKAPQGASRTADARRGFHDAAAV